MSPETARIPGRRVVAAAVLLLAAAGLAACGSDEDLVDAGDEPTSSTTAPERVVVEAEGLRLGLELEPEPLVEQAAATFTVLVENRSDEPVTLEFRSGLRADVALLRHGTGMYRWSEERAFTQALEDEVLDPGDSLTYTLEEEQLDVTPGEYTLRLEPAFAPLIDEAASTTVQVVAAEEE